MKKIIALLIKLGIIPADKESDALKAVESLGDDDTREGAASDESNSLDPSTIKDPAIRAVIERLIRQNAAVQQMNKDLLEAMTSEKKAREDAQKTILDRQKSEREKNVKDTVEKALAEGRIAAADKDAWTKSLTGDFETNSKLLLALPVNPALKKNDPSGASAADPSKASGGEHKAPAIPGPIGRGNQSILSKVVELNGNVQAN